MTAHALVLGGCRAEPLGAYLKALGVLRAVARQADPDAVGYWDGSVFVLVSSCSRQELITFFLEKWAPSPVLSPWNKDAGITAAALQGPAKEVAGSSEPRLGAYRDAIAVAQRVLQGTTGAPGVADARRTKRDDAALKQALMVSLRNRLPDEALAWLDVVAATGDRVQYSPLFKSGGNDGRFEFSAQYMEAVLALVGTGARPTAVQAWLEAALFERPAELKVRPVGMLFPGQADVRSSPIGDTSVVNPWDSVLALEGVLLFSAALARRTGTAQPAATFPFMLPSTAVANTAAAAGEQVDGELWAPLWRNPATFQEVQRMLGEGRLEWGGRQSAGPVDAVRAVGALGTDRGITAFGRHVIVQRRGRSRLVQAVGRIEVRERPHIMASAQADAWIGQLRASGGDAGPGARQTLEGYERAVWMAATRGRPEDHLGVLAAVAACEAALGVSPKLKEKARLQPVTSLTADVWWPAVDDHSPELRLAAALASARDRDGSSLRTMLRPQRRDARARLVWREGGAVVEGFGRRPVLDVLADALVARTIARLGDDESARPGGSGGVAGRQGPPPQEPEPEARGVQPAFERYPVTARLGDVAALLGGEIDMGRFETALAALLALEGWETLRPGGQERTVSSPGGVERLPPPAFGVLAPFFFPGEIRLGGTAIALYPEVHWPHLLRAGQLDAVVSEAILRLRMAQREPLVAGTPADAGVMVVGLEARSMAAALLVPIGRRAVMRLLEWVTVASGDDAAPEAEPTTDQGGQP